MSATLGFTIDDFTRRHLRDFFWAGMTPNDWDYSDLELFEAWLEDNADDLYDDMSWSALARLFDEERETR